ncbi:MAG TPA: hypothetical protein PLD10_13140 [Rhodopila sp.]|nr:hypothetical protein [Rhodopila sp.]
MPIKTETVPAEVVVDHNKVKLYRCYEDDDIDRPEKFWFTTNPDKTENFHVEAFDVRDLEVPSAPLITSGHPPDFVRPKGRTVHELMATPEYQASVQAWAEWFDNEQPALIKKALIEAIEAGILNK